MPHKKAGDGLPEQLIEFFDELAMQMLLDENFEQCYECIANDVSKDEDSQNSLLELRNAVKRGEVLKASRASVEQYDLEILLHGLTRPINLSDYLI